MTISTIAKRCIWVPLVALGALVQVACGSAQGGCPADFEMCGQECTAILDDSANCGMCGRACDPGERCQVGQCVVSCQAGLENCSGVCTNTVNDPAHCGGCNLPCGAEEVCQNSTCVFECVGGTTDCGGSCVNTTNDPAHCGGCNLPCGAEEVCQNSTCAFACVGGTANCGGACVNTTNDPAHCGGCNLPCAPVEACIQSTCTRMNSFTRWSDGSNQWPDQACNPTNSFGSCNTNAVNHANAWANYVCRQNGHAGGAWTGRKIAGCSGAISMYCLGGSIPCNPSVETTCVAADQTRIELTCFDYSLTKMSEGTAAWPDQACNPTNSFGSCDTNAADHAYAWASYVCQQNDWNGGFWTGVKAAGCNGAISMYCLGGSIPCNPSVETTCAPGDQTTVQLTCF